MPRARGFTLVELAVVLAIMGLLLGSLMYTLSARVDQQNRSDTQRRLEDARDMLLAFAIVNGRLPCPAASDGSTGAESVDTTTYACTGTGTANYSGFLPAVTIGFQPTDTSGYALDAWGNRIRYAVSATTWLSANAKFTKAHVANSATAAWSITQKPADLLICSAALGSATACDSGATISNTDTLVAVIYSIGKNGSTTYNPATNAARSGVGTNEGRNLDGNSMFVYRGVEPSTAAGGEYDDMMVWIPAGVLYSRMISAGLLP